MSKLFFDSWLDFSGIDKKIKLASQDRNETAELWDLIDGIIHHRVFDLILGKLPKESHEEFIELFHKCPHDEIRITAYLKEKTDEGIVDYIKEGLKGLENEIISSIDE